MILLDRHGPVWAVAESKRLSRAAAIRKAQTEDGLEGVTVKPLTAEIAALATQFPDDYPRDPADRLIGGTAAAEGLVLITRPKDPPQPLPKTIW